MMVAWSVGTRDTLMAAWSAAQRGRSMVLLWVALMVAPSGSGLAARMDFYWVERMADRLDTWMAGMMACLQVGHLVADWVADWVAWMAGQKAVWLGFSRAAEPPVGKA